MICGICFWEEPYVLCPASTWQLSCSHYTHPQGTEMEEAQPHNMCSTVTFNSSSQMAQQEIYRHRQKSKITKRIQIHKASLIWYVHMCEHQT
jgi:hypothetical protein